MIDTIKTKAEVREYLEEITGMNVKEQSTQWTKLLEDGVVIHLHVRRWRAKTTLDLEDLGLYLDSTQKSNFTRYMKLGKLLLLPPDFLDEANSIETGARNNIKKRRFSYDTPYGAFVPLTAFDDWLESDQDFEGRYLALGRRLFDEWEDLVGRTLDSHAINARVNYRRAKALTPEIMDRLEYFREDLFVDAYMEKIKRAIPAREFAYSAWKYERDIRYLPAPSAIAIDKIAGEEAIKDIRAQSDFDVARKRAEMEQAYLDEEMARDRRKDMEQTRMRVRDMVAKQETEKVEKFFGGLASQIRETIYSVISTVDADIAKRGFLHPRKVVALQEIGRMVKNMNFYGDKEIDEIWEPIQKELDKASGDRDLSTVRTELLKAETRINLGLSRLNQDPRSRKGASIKVDQAARAKADRRERRPEIEEVQPVRSQRRTRREKVTA